MIEEDDDDKPIDPEPKTVNFDGWLSTDYVKMCKALAAILKLDPWLVRAAMGAAVGASLGHPAPKETLDVIDKGLKRYHK